MTTPKNHPTPITDPQPIVVPQLETHEQCQRLPKTLGKMPLACQRDWVDRKLFLNSAH